jgi:hypothetical protein
MKTNTKKTERDPYSNRDVGLDGLRLSARVGLR